MHLAIFVRNEPEAKCCLGNGEGGETKRKERKKKNNKNKKK